MLLPVKLSTLSTSPSFTRNPSLTLKSEGERGDFEEGEGSSRTGHTLSPEESKREAVILKTPHPFSSLLNFFPQFRGHELPEATIPRKKRVSPTDAYQKSRSLLTRTTERQCTHPKSLRRVLPRNGGSRDRRTTP